MIPEALERWTEAQLRAELRARAAPDENHIPNPDLENFDSETLFRVVREKQAAIYGGDDRQEVDIDRVPEADAVVALFAAADVIDTGLSTSILTTQTFGMKFHLCSSERFWDQPSGGIATGFLVAPDVIATAGHVLEDIALADIRFVFGFKMVTDTVPPGPIPHSEIYSATSVIASSNVGDSDWALLRLSRRVIGHVPLRLRRVAAGKVPDHQPVFVIGHPNGLPTKVAGGARVRDNAPAAMFRANLDTYGGNSGSPVINEHSREVEGILVNGVTDFFLIGTGTSACQKSCLCPDTNTGNLLTDCVGQGCTRVTEFSGLI